MDLLKDAAGNAGIDALSKQIGLSSRDAGKLVEALSPAMTRSIQRQAESDGGLANLRRALETGGHQQYVKNPELLANEATRLDGNKILGHLFGSKDVSRNVAAHAAGETGLDTGLIKKALPLLASLVMGSLSKKSDGGKALSKPSSGSGSGVLGGLAGMLFSKGDSGIDDVMDLARKFF